MKPPPKAPPPSPSDGKVRRFSASQIYFPFASGSFSYDCVECGSKCCRGFGYLAATASELSRQLSSRPVLRFFARRHESAPAVHRVSNCAPACYFLEGDGRCATHVTDGYDAKPETCRLFPFNDLLIVGDYLVVAPHSTLCPLRVAGKGASASLSSHSVLENEIVCRGIAGPIRRSGWPFADVGGLIQLERRLFAGSACVASRSFLDFAAHTVLETAAVLEGRSYDRLSQAHVRTDIDAFVTLCEGILEISTAEQPSAIDELMILLTPYLRSRFLFGEPSLGFSRDVFRIPHATVVIFLCIQIARQAGMTEETFQTVSRLQALFSDLALLLMDANRPVIWRHDADIGIRSAAGPYSRGFIRLAKALLPSVQARHRVPLGDLLQEHNCYTGVDHSSFLLYVAERLRGRLVPLDSPTGHAPVTLRRRFQRWGFSVLDEQTLRAAASRLRSSSSNSAHRPSTGMTPPGA